MADEEYATEEEKKRMEEMRAMIGVRKASLKPTETSDKSTFICRTDPALLLAVCVVHDVVSIADACACALNTSSV